MRDARATGPRNKIDIFKPRHLATDSAYGSAANPAWLVKERQIDRVAYPDVRQVNRTDGTFSRSDFVADRNHYTCPQGKLLVQFRRAYAIPRSGITKDGTGCDSTAREQVRLPGLNIQEAVLSEHAAAQSATRC
jgi:hypothetical protein